LFLSFIFLFLNLPPFLYHCTAWTITERGFESVPFGIITPLLFTLFFHNPYITYFITTFCIFEILSQEFHKWSHRTKKKKRRRGSILYKFGVNHWTCPTRKASSCFVRWKPLYNLQSLQSFP
jgi:hypothetical protein